ncbi:hypothetical protein KC480_05960 [Bacillus velezensis]|uniref:hypothetical protein n=1 Tax=Bacillus velezensis TaxID=492670 RepID=UPI001E5FBCB4|nr:hypothetical protein [Bacillus velezensis]MCD7911070.1 hypothetical protein [Bacillus velezensis]
MAYNQQKKRTFDLNQYETVKSRKTRFRMEYPDCIILPVPLSDVNFAANYILMGALIWKDKKQLESSQFDNIQKLAERATPQNAGMLMTAIAIQSNADSSGYSLSIAGGKGADQNAWVENAEESAVGRALDNMGYHSGSASKEEMEKVQHILDSQKLRVQLENNINALYIELTSRGFSAQQLGQIINQTLKPFEQLSELSVPELEKLLNTLNEIGGINKYQNQQSPQNPPSSLPPAGFPAPPVNA